VGNRDIELMALQFEGQARARRGEVLEGMALMDEAMVAVVSGQVGPWATGQIVCQTLTACQRVGDYRRAAEWLESADRACADRGISGMSADCRIHRAGILRVRGSWARAESEARIGCAGHVYGWHVGWGWCEIGEIHLQMGDFTGAEEAFALAHERGYPPHPGLALLRLAQGKVELASKDIEQAFAAVGASEDLTARAHLLDARVRIALAANDTMTARASADELARIASACSSVAFEAFAACADGWVRIAEGDTSGAAAALRRGIEALVAIEMPYDAAMARPGLALALSALDDRDGALLELRAARSTFAQLGAALDERHVVALLAELDEATIPPLVVGKTFMFTDIERSTILLEAFGDEAWDRMLQWHDRTLREAINASGGREVKHEGDGFFAAFDEPTSAIRCAVAIQQGLSRHRREHGFAPEVRIGLHAGSATERDGDFFGLAVNTAARVMSLAVGGEIVATAETVPANEHASPPRAVQLKGVSDPVTVVTVGWKEQT
jgi:class 3 adenylate cyclase